jgi:hypothetical protein
MLPRWPRRRMAAFRTAMFPFARGASRRAGANQHKRNDKEIEHKALIKRNGKHD